MFTPLIGVKWRVNVEAGGGRGGNLYKIIIKEDRAEQTTITLTMFNSSEAVI